MSTLSFGDITVEPGETKRGRLGSIYLFDGTRVDLPLMAVRGKKDGPVFWMSAAMHGQELSGIAAIWEIMKKHINPAELRGTIVAAPLLNPLSFGGGTYFTPQDGYNFNRVFPGSPKGGLTERMVNFVVEEGIQKADYLLDFHCNPDPAICFSIVMGPSNQEPGLASLKMAEAFGVTVIEAEPSSETGVRSGTMSETASEMGKPMIVVELIPWWRITPLAVQVGVRGALNVLKSLGMIDGAIEKQEGIPVVPGILARTQLLSDRGGLVTMYKQPAEPVKKGEVVGHVVDSFGDPLEDIVSPVDGWMMAYPLMFSSAAYSGEITAMIAYKKK